MQNETITPAEPTNSDSAMPTQSPEPPVQKSRKTLWLNIACLVAILLISLGIIIWQSHKNKKASPQTVTQSAQQPASTSQNLPVQGLSLDQSKNYGNKYANGILPVGDSKYSTTTPKAGFIYTCSSYAQNLTSGQGGAQTRGPWFVNNNTGYDINKKLHVQGSVIWQASFSNKVSGSTRTIITNDLPNHKTGTFPVSPTDPSYAYDRNPNLITAQSYTYNLNANPTYGDPQCMGGEAGIMLSGVALFNGFDAGGRDAGAWEIQDNCEGHPQKGGVYHYHTLSSCISNISIQTVIGFALDGFPITGPQVGANNILTTSDLDECHGLTSQIILDGKLVTIYHYVMTQDFPYSISCFRSKAIQPPDLQAQPPH